MIRRQDAALAYAAALDRTQAAGPDEDTELRMYRIGELLGGISEAGFRADLLAHLDEIDGDMIAEAGGYADTGVPLVGGYWIARACEDAAEAWLLAAQVLMQREDARIAA